MGLYFDFIALTCRLNWRCTFRESNIISRFRESTTNWGHIATYFIEILVYLLCTGVVQLSKQSATKVELVQMTGQAIMDAFYWLRLEHLFNFQFKFAQSSIFLNVLCLCGLIG